MLDNSFANGQKPVLLIFPHDLMAHYLRCLQLADYLQPYFNIRILYSSRYGSFVSRAGFDTFDCTTLNSDKVQQLTESFDFSWLNYKDLSNIYNEQVKVISDLSASVVLGDMAPTLKMAAEKTGAFYISLLNGYMSRHYFYVRRMPKGYPLYKLFNLLPTSLFTYFTNMGEHMFFHEMHRPFSKIRRRNALPAKYSYMQELEGDMNLLCDLPELFPQKDLPSNYRFIPPLYHKSDQHDIEIFHKLNRGKKTLYVSMGSSGNWNAMSFLNNPIYQKYNIVTTGDFEKVIQGANVFAYTFINSTELFKVADLTICHGGNGTVYQSLSHGIPVLCKTSHLEQEYNVDGIERHQLGKSLDDLKSDQEYIALIDDWIQKKGSKPLLLIENKIAEARSKFDATIKEVAELLLQTELKHNF